MINEEPNGPGFGGPRGNANLGDYVMTQSKPLVDRYDINAETGIDGFDQVLEQLMHAAGPQGPIPASEAVVEGLPRITFTEESLGELNAMLFGDVVLRLV